MTAYSTASNDFWSQAAAMNTAREGHGMTVYKGARHRRVLKGHKDWVHHVWLCTAPNEHIVVSVEQGLSMYTIVLVHDMRIGKWVCASIECASCKLS
jgi:hypothetical protein